MSSDVLSARAIEGDTGRKRRQVRAEQVRLLYANADTGIAVTVFLASILGYIQWTVIPHRNILGWVAYMVIVAAGRFILARFYWRDSLRPSSSGWGAAFSVGAGLSGAGWGLASFLLYPEASLTNQVFLAFLLGGVMLGAVSLLAPRPEAFLAFIVPVGLPVAVRFLTGGNRIHLAMGLFGAAFIINLLITARNIYRTVSVSLNLRFENRELLDNLQAAKAEMEALNQQLEFRVKERTSELHAANDRLHAEIEQRKQAEDELLRAHKLEALGVLAGGIAHDFNNLLTGVIGSASLALDMAPPGSPAVELLERILKTGEQLAHLTRQMLAYSGKGRFFLEPLNLSDLIVEISPLVQPSISKKIELRLELEPDLPPIEADKGQMQQVFMNLVLNAAEAIGPEPGLIEVKTGLQTLDGGGAADLPAGRYICLEVRDTGCGMDDATKARIFDPFFSTKFVGRGLGLAAVGGIVRGHKGAVTVVSTPGEGTRFTVRFPVAEAAAVASPVAARQTNLAGRGTILLVDDEEIVRDTAKSTLEHFGYQVLLTDNGLAAIDAFKRHPGEIALVILDLSMPGMGGDEVLPELRRIRPNVKVVVSSGYNEAETMRLFAGQQVSGFLQKPFTPTRLAEKVKGAIVGS